jgi:hypothetical protein
MWLVAAARLPSEVEMGCTPEAGYDSDSRLTLSLVSSWLVSTSFASLLCAL